MEDIVRANCLGAGLVGVGIWISDQIWSNTVGVNGDPSMLPDGRVNDSLGDDISDAWCVVECADSMEHTDESALESRDCTVCPWLP